MRLTRKATYSWLLALLVPVFFASVALSHPIEEHAEDAALLHLPRALVFSAALDDGWLLPRWAPQLNGALGSPLFAFYPPGMYYALHVLHQLGLPHTVGYRVLVALAIVTASCGAFALGLALWKRADAALVCAAAYAYAPYLQQDLLQRGSPEGLAIVLLPWVLCTLLLLAERPSGLRLAAASILWALVILTHNLTALLFLPVTALFALFLALRFGRKALLWSGAALAIGALLSSFHILPFLFERGYVQVDNVTKASWARPADQPLRLDQLVSLPLVLDIGLDNNSMMQHRINLLQILVLILGIASLFFWWRRKLRRELCLVAGAIGLAGSLMLLQTDHATVIWRTCTFLDMLQFRWRLLGLFALPTAIVAGSLFGLLSEHTRPTVALLACSFFVAIQLPSLYPQLLRHAGPLAPPTDAKQVTDYALSINAPDLTSLHEFEPCWREWGFSTEEAKWARLTPIANLPEGARLISDERRTGWIRARFETPSPFAASMHTLYYPGWIGYVDGQRQTPRPSEGGGAYATVDVNTPGEHIVELRYEGTPIQHVADAATIMTALGLLLTMCLWRTRPASPLDAVLYPKPSWFVPAIIVALAVAKVGWLDPQTQLLRHNSTPQAIAGARTYTDVRFGDGMRLCGYTLPQTRFHPGDTLTITLWWQRTDELAEPNASCFVHLLGTRPNPAAGHYLWGQEDKLERPADYTLGKLHRMTFRFRILPDAPPGPYKLEIGWWRPETQEFLSPRIVAAGGELEASPAGFLLLSGLEVH